MRTADGGRRPDFVVVGAPKAGTTWLYHNLAANPGVFLPPIKEPRYYGAEPGERVTFSGPGDDVWMRNFVRSAEQYGGLFAGAGEDQMAGEASSDYLYRSAVAAPRIREEIPEARIVVLLRDPAHRAHSNWLHHVRDGRETLPFGDAIGAEPERIRSGWAWWWHYVERGFYARQLAPFFDNFPEDQILIALYEELQRDPPALITRVCSFLGVDPVIDRTVTERRNESVAARSPAHAAARRVVRPSGLSRALLPQRLRTAIRLRFDRATLHRPVIGQEEYRKLQRLYADDVSRLAGIADLDLSSWTARA
jgi:hypothetical protein